MNSSIPLVLTILALCSCNQGASFGGKNKAAPPTSTSRPTNASNAEPSQSVSQGPNGAGDASDIEQRLRREGAQTGEIQVSLSWDGENDLDLHMLTPTGEHVFFGAPKDSADGFLDVDMNAGGERSMTPVENVFWPTSAAPRGRYRIFVHHFLQNDTNGTTPFKVRLKIGSSISLHRGSATFSSSGADQQWRDEDNATVDNGAIKSLLEATAVEVHNFEY